MPESLYDMAVPACFHGALIAPEESILSREIQPGMRMSHAHRGYNPGTGLQTVLVQYRPRDGMEEGEGMEDQSINRESGRTAGEAGL